MNATFSTTYWHALDDGKIQCDVCPRACHLSEGQRGLCYVRGRENNEVVLYSYGRSSGFCIDPIEKKPLNHFYPGTPVLSFGTAGCNLACKFCQNWDISKSRQTDTLAGVASPEKLAQTAKAYDCRSIAYTYNDPVIFMEYANDVAQACHEQGIFSVAVTAGYICPEPRKAFFKHMDAANVDLKAFSEKFYHKLCGGHLHHVLDTLEYIHHETNCWLEITTLLIPGQNDSPQEIEQLATWVAEHLSLDTPLHFSAFHPDWKMRDISPTPPETLSMARHIAKEMGLKHVYTGNVHDTEGSSTYCTNCAKRLIERDWYQLGDWHLTSSGQCEYCKTLLAGRFNGPPGMWGRKRQPVYI